MLPTLRPPSRLASAGRALTSDDLAPAPGTPRLPPRRLQPAPVEVAPALCPPLLAGPRRPSSTPAAADAHHPERRSPLRRVQSARTSLLQEPESSSGELASDEGGGSDTSNDEAPQLRQPSPASPLAVPSWDDALEHLLSSAAGHFSSEQALRERIERLKPALEAMFQQAIPAQRRSRWDRLCSRAAPAEADPRLHAGPAGRLRARFDQQVLALQLELLAQQVFTRPDLLDAEIERTLARVLQLQAGGPASGVALEVQGLRLRALYLRMSARQRQVRLHQEEQLPLQEPPDRRRLRALRILSLRVADKGEAMARRELVDTESLHRLRGPHDRACEVHTEMVRLACPPGLPAHEKYRLQRLCLDMPWPVDGAHARQRRTPAVAGGLRLLMLETLARDGTALSPVLPFREAIRALAARAPEHLRASLLEHLPREVAAPGPGLGATPAPTASLAEPARVTQVAPTHADKG